MRSETHGGNKTRQNRRQGKNFKEQDIKRTTSRQLQGHILSAGGMLLIAPEHTDACVRLPSHIELCKFTRLDQEFRMLLVIVHCHPETCAPLLATVFACFGMVLAYM